MDKKTEYLEKLKDPRWQKKRLEIFERDKWECRACGDKGTNLHIHHIFYLSKKEPWDIPDGLLITFCERCHKNKCDKGPCQTCDDYMSDCYGTANHSNSLINLIGILLDYVWRDEGNLGRFDYHSKLTNLIYSLK